MAQEVQSTVQTLAEVLATMAPFAGGSLPNDDTQEYADWVRWVGQKQEEFARRAFWRRCLTREAINLTPGFVTLLPTRFHKPNGLYMLIVDEEDWTDPENEAEQYVFVEMINDVTSVNYARWEMRFDKEITVSTPAILWYFSNPPKPVLTTDKLLLPGDMVAYSSLQEYFRTTGSEGSEDKVEQMAENRFQEYLGMEVIPSKEELLTHKQTPGRVDRLGRAKSYYTGRTNRNSQ